MNRTRIAVLAAVLLAAIAAVVIVFASGAFGGGSGAASSDNTYPTSAATIRRQTLSSQTQVNATLGYADPSTIVISAGAAPSAVEQAQQTAQTGASQLAAAQSTAAADGTALAQARATLAADRAKLAVDCAGDAAGSSSGSTQSPSQCATDEQAVTADEQTVTQASTKVQADTQSVASARTSLAGAQAGLAEAQASATLYGQSSAYTQLPAVGQVVRRNGTLYEVSGQPVTLLYGTVAAWRAFAPGMSSGKDVAELNANLRYLGYPAPTGDAFTSATAAAIEAFQSAHGSSPTGTLPLGSVVFEPGAVRVTSVTPTVGATVQAGPVLGITSMRRVVSIALDAADQTSVAVGDRVSITLPDESTTPGRVTYVGTVATTPSSDQGNGGDSSPTIEVDVTPTDPAATGRLDQAPVLVSITTATVHDALVAPVASLLALASGGYAVEVIGAGDVHHLEAVDLGLFDDNEGLVQVSGPAVAAGQRVVVPGE